MRFIELNLGKQLTDYHEAWDFQRTVHAEVVSGKAENTVIFVEHSPVYTAGRRTRQHERPQDGTAVVDVDRGGKITWHGPGQLVAYPIIKLGNPIDVVAYVRDLESAVMDVCSRFGVATIRVDGRSGVWCDSSDINPWQRKICAIGVRVAQGVTMHGLALNCSPDLNNFKTIVPCGIDDADVTSLSLESEVTVTIQQVLPYLKDALTEQFQTLG